MKSFLHWFSLAVAAFAFAVIISSAANKAYADAAGSAAPAVIVTDTVHDVASTPPKLPPSPVDDPTGFAGVVRDSWKQGAYLPVVLLMLYGGLLVALKYVAWLRVGRRAAATAAALTALSTAIAALSSGAVPTAAGLLSAIGAGLALYLRPEPTSETVTIQPAAV